MTEAHAIADRYLLNRIVVNQPVYNMFDRHIEKEIIPTCTEKGIGQVVYSPLAQGILAGKYRKGEKIPEDSRAAKRNWKEDRIPVEQLEKVEQLEGIAKEIGLTLPQLALAWVLRQPNVSSALIGASRPEQVEENCAASGVKLSQDVLDKIEEILQNRP